MSVGTHSMLGCLEVNGEATEASASEREIPAWAAFSAPQSLAPSPHIPTKYLMNKEKESNENISHNWMSIFISKQHQNTITTK